MKRKSIAFDLGECTFKVNHSKLYSGGYHCAVLNPLGYIIIHMPHEIVISYNFESDLFEEGIEDTLIYITDDEAKHRLMREVEAHCTMMRNFYNKALNALNGE